MDTHTNQGHTKMDRRIQVRRERRNLTPSQKTAFDDARSTRLFSQIKEHHPAMVAAYVSTEDEPDTRALLRELKEMGIPTLLPVIDSMSSPAWAQWEGEEFVPGDFGILQPQSPRLSFDALRRADTIIVPGLAGTPTGARLGRGGGWYDRALDHAAKGTPVWLLLNDAEVMDRLPVEPHDRPVTSIITESRWIDCHCDD